jgi:hypothetical protein
VSQGYIRFPRTELTTAAILNTTSNVKTITRLPASIAKSEVLSVLHDDALMLSLNPLLKSSTLLPPSGSSAFYKTVPKELKPASKEAIESIAVYSVVEAHGGSGEETATWRGGWAKRFIPDEIVYDTSMQNKETGMMTITHAPMGVHSLTIWSVREATETDPVAEDGNKNGLVLEVSGSVESNRMLMGFIKTTLQESYNKLAKDFVILLENEVAKKRGGPEGTAQESAVADKLAQPASDHQVEVEVVA